jgi:phosphate/phosphite/phosphonate ABC transporter binding protein
VPRNAARHNREFAAKPIIAAAVSVVVRAEPKHGDVTLDSTDMGAITFAVVPSSTPGDARLALDALCIALTKLLDAPVHGINCASYSDLALELEKDRVDYAWMSPTLMILTNENIQLRPLLSAVRDGKTDYRAVFFVDGKRQMRSLEELRGQTVAWVDRTSASGYIVPRIHLAARGLDPAHFFRKELFLRSHAEAVRAVLDGRADVGATYGQRPEEAEAVRRAGFLDVAPERHVRVLEWTQAIPNDVIVGHGLLSKPEHRIVANAILTLAEHEAGRRLLYNVFHAEQFMTPPRNVLKPVQELVELAREHGLMSQL